MKKILDGLLITTFFILTTSQNIGNDACIEYSGNICIRCGVGNHVQNGQCYENIFGCISYITDNECIQCRYPPFQLINNTCQIMKESNIQNSQVGNLYNSTSFNINNIDNKNEQSGYLMIPHENVYNWPTFMALNNFVQLGQYGLHISQMSNPVHSVHYRINGGQYSYKVLYLASGGGLFLCIADVTPVMFVNIRNMIPISTNLIVENCCNYNINGSCLQCRQGTHLQGKKCYPNYGGCTKYFENICVECKDYYFLIENRCVSDCLSVADARSILYYESNTSKSTFQLNYGILLSYFYPNLQFINQQIPTIIEQALNQTSLYPGIITNNTNNNEILYPFQLSGLNILNKIPLNYTMQPQTSETLPGYLFDKISSTLNKQPALITNINKCNSNIKKVQDQKGNNCKIQGINGTCNKCMEQYFINEEGICQEISTLCIEISQSDGKCIRCISGYFLKNGRCRVFGIV